MRKGDKGGGQREGEDWKKAERTKIGKRHGRWGLGMGELESMRSEKRAK